jgi:hypothetical protein
MNFALSLVMDHKLAILRRWVFSLLLSFFSFSLSFSQLIFNEASNRNYTRIVDGDGDYPDWIELYNNGSGTLNLSGYYLSDEKSNLTKWPLPNQILTQNQWMLIFASGKYNAATSIHHWETAINDSDTWKWINPDAGTSSSWNTLAFNDAAWTSGSGGFGFSDGDDNTTFPSTNISVYNRINFTITDTASIKAAVLHVDYDDGFVAYLNGQEIARSNVSGIPVWNTPADYNHEALMYQSQNPEEFLLDMSLIKSVWKQGVNVLSIEGRNTSTASSDMTLRTFLSFGMSSPITQFGTVPGWFNLQGTSYVHTNFKISEKGETIYLSNAGIIVDTIAVPELPLDHSYGRSQDGAATRGIFISPTPEQSNNTQTAYINGYEPLPVVNHEGGFYAAAVTISIAKSFPSATAQIRYTLDGQTPTASSTLYSGPFIILSSKVLKVRCFSTASKLPGETITNSYFINETPTPAGIMCITTDNVNLYGPTGIYDNYTTDWKKPCYIEYFEPATHTLVFKQKAGLKIDGGAGGSRSQPQHSFRVEPGNGTLGDGDLDYPLIPDRPNRESYETFYLRNGSNQYLFYPCKDAIETKCMAYNTYTTYSAYTPVQVYLNGQYWGWYELREKQDADYFKQNYGIDKDSIDLVGASYFYGGVLRSIEGENSAQKFTDDYTNFLSFNTTSPTFWNDADKIYDLNNYVDYVCAQSWIGNTDWPFNNIKIFRSPETGKRWRFGLIDLEWSLEPNGWQNSSFDHIGFMLNYNTSYPYLNIWRKSIDNSTFHDYFINRFADLMNTNWEASRLQQIANDVYNVTRPEMSGEYTRWGNPSDIPGQLATFDAAHQTMLNELNGRTAYVRNHIQNNFSLPKQVTINLNVLPAGAGKIKISTVKPDNYPWTGIYFDGVPVKIEAIANPGYTFVNWNSNPLLSSLSNPVFLDTLTLTTTNFTANFLSNGETNKVTIAEINYNSSPLLNSEDWVEFWNYSTNKTADLSGWYFTDNDPRHVYTFPANTILNANERIVVVNSDQKFTAQYPGVVHLTRFDFNFGNSGDAVRLFDYNDNLIAEVTYQDQAPWPTGADGQGKTLEQHDPQNPIGSSSNWFDGCTGGSPGTAFVSPCTPTSGIVQAAKVSLLSVKPNPTEGKVQISILTEESTSLSLMDYTGTIIYNSTEVFSSFDLDISSYPQGIYLLKIQTNKGLQDSYKIVKQ